MGFSWTTWAIFELGQWEVKVKRETRDKVKQLSAPMATQGGRVHRWTVDGRLFNL